MDCSACLFLTQRIYTRPIREGNFILIGQNMPGENFRSLSFVGIERIVYYHFYIFAYYHRNHHHHHHRDLSSYAEYLQLRT